jgi:flagellar basal-body rod modification protein FlgD
MSAIDPITGRATDSATEARIPVKTLGQDDFLKLLIAQLTTQDPLSPQKDTEFISQMASFSSLEQTRSMQADLARLRADQQVLQANSLLGRTVEVQVDEVTRTSGLVSAVLMEAGKPNVVVGDQSYDLSRVLVIAPTAAS